MKTRALAQAAIALLSTTVMVPAALAQDADAPLMAVYDKPRSDYDAPGIRSGGFLFKPSVAAEGRFDSNIFKKDKGDETDDFIAIIKPSLKLDSNWNNHSLGLFADAKIAKYSDNGGEDYEDFNFGGNGRIDISRGTSISTSLNYSDGHEDRGSPDQPNSPSTPTQFSLIKATVGFKRDEGLFSVALDGDFTKQDFDNATLLDANLNEGTDTVRNDDRDRETTNGSIRIGYHLTDEYEAFAKFTATRVTYTNPTDKVNGVHEPRRDSDGWDAVGGVAFKLSGVAEGDFHLGYVKRDFDSANFGDVSDFKFGASVLWAPTGLTSARFTVTRNVVETTVSAEADDGSGQTVGAAGILSTLYSVDLQHELQRNLLLNAKASFTKMDYVNTIREDDMTNLGVGVRYLLNRNFSVNADYVLDKRATNEANQDYKNHSFLVSLTAAF